MDTLRLKALPFYGFHGTEPWEKEVGRRFLVDVELTHDMTTQGQSDKLADAIDYRRIYAAARRVLEGEKHDLIERVAWRLMEEMFKEFEVEAVWIRVAKPEAPIGGINMAVEAEIGRTRQEYEALTDD